MVRGGRVVGGGGWVGVVEGGLGWREVVRGRQVQSPVEGVGGEGPHLALIAGRWLGVDRAHVMGGK